MTNYIGRHSVLGAHQTQAVLDTTETKISESKVPDATFVDKTGETTDTTSTTACEEAPTSSTTAETVKEENAMLNSKETNNITSHAVSETTADESTTHVTEEHETETVLGITDEIAATDSKEDVDLTLEQIERFLKSEEATDAKDAEPTVSEITTEDATDTENETSYVSKVEEPEKEEAESSDIDAPAASEEEKSEKKSAAETLTSKLGSNKTEENEIDLCRFNLIATYRDIDTDEVLYEVQGESFDKIVTVKAHLNEISDKLNARGVYISRKDAQKLIENIDLASFSQNTERISTYKEIIGWTSKMLPDGKCELEFRGHKMLSANRSAVYDGSMDITPVGEHNQMTETMKQLISQNIALSFWIISGLAASTIGYLKQCGEELQTIIIDAFGDTGTGKTTTAKLAVAMGCNPFHKPDKESFFYDFNSTSAALYDKLNNNYGFPVIIDDLGTASKQTEILPFLYSVANGVGRGRYREAKKNWATLVITTNEVSILSCIESTDGIDIRLLNIGDDSFTNSADNARAVEDFCRTYHGLPIYLYSRALFKQEQAEVIEVFRKKTAKAREKLNIDDNFKERAAKIIAVYQLTAWMATKIFKVAFDMKWLEQFLVKHINMKNSKEKTEIIYERFLAYVSANRPLFRLGKPSKIVRYRDGVICRGNLDRERLDFEDDQFTPTTRYIGYINMIADNDRWVSEYIVILQSAFEEWLKKDQGTGINSKKLLRQWADINGYLKKGPKSDRLAVKIDINGYGIKNLCYMINCSADIATCSTSPEESQGVHN